MLKENRMPIINDNATDAELAEMVRKMNVDGPINLRKEPSPDNDCLDKGKTLEELGYYTPPPLDGLI